MFMPALNHSLREHTGKMTPQDHPAALFNLPHLSDAHIIDAVSPAPCECVEPLAEDTRRNPVAPWTKCSFDLSISAGDNIDNASKKI